MVKRKLNIKKIISLVNKATKGIDSIEEGAVGYYGYGFLFMDLDNILDYIDFPGSGGVCRLGTTREIMKDFKRKINVFDNISIYDKGYDISLIGSLKTIVPTLKFGGNYEHLFEVWMFVKTPDNRQFPATLYYGASGLSIGGWDADCAYRFTNDKRYLSIFPEAFKSQINFSPHNLSKDDKEAFAEALELALRKVPLSDFYGVYKHDFGNRLMGIKNGKPISVEMGLSPKFDNLNLFLNYTMKLNIDKKEFENWDMH